MDKIETLETLDLALGNTKQAPNKQPPQLKKWFFTFNNYKKEDIETLETKFKTICKEYIFQEEKGENGTCHLQGVIFLKKKMRWSEFKLSNLIHWEKCKSYDDAIDYCSKEESRNGNIYTNINLDDRIEPEIELITPDKPFQLDIIERIKLKPDKRTIHWYYDTIGGVGKTSFSKYLCVKHNAIFISGGEYKDIINHIFNCKKLLLKKNAIVIFNLPRNSHNNISYKAVESIKDGIIFNSKFETGQLIFNSPHIFIFSNFEPDTDALSQDRWHIVNINEDYNNIKPQLIEKDEYTKERFFLH